MLLSLVIVTVATAAEAAPADSATVAASAAAAGPGLPPASVRRWQTGLLRPDRLQHASASFALAAGGGIASERKATAFTFAFTVGLAKECWDARRGHFDTLDLAADAAGSLLGALTTRIR